MAAIDTNHLNELIMRLGREGSRLAEARTVGERDQRKVKVDACKREIAAERAFLGLPDEPELTDAELLAALGL
jgi:hypothetical protein